MIIIRKFIPSDSEYIVDILKTNGQFYSSTIEGPDSMIRVAKCSSAVFNVALIDNKPIGVIKAVFDGSRALIHLLSVNPDFQRKGVGKRLVNSVISELKEKGASTLSVTTSESSQDFWEKLLFRRLPVYLMLRDPL